MNINLKKILKKEQLKSTLILSLLIGLVVVQLIVNGILICSIINKNTLTDFATNQEQSRQYDVLSIEMNLSGNELVGYITRYDPVKGLCYINTTGEGEYTTLTLHSITITLEDNPTFTVYEVVINNTSVANLTLIPASVFSSSVEQYVTVTVYLNLEYNNVRNILLTGIKLEGYNPEYTKINTIGES